MISNDMKEGADSADPNKGESVKMENGVAAHTPDIPRCPGCKKALANSGPIKSGLWAVIWHEKCEQEKRMQLNMLISP